MNMNYFDAIAGSLFKRTKDGRWAVYPWGIFGAGYILSDEEKHRDVRNFVRRWYLVSLLSMGLIGLFLGWPRVLFLGPFSIGVYVFVVRRQLHGLAKTREQLTLAETWREQAKGYNRAFLWAFEVVSLLFVAAGVLILVVDRANWFVALASIGFFGLCGMVFGLMIRLKGERQGR